MTIIEKLITEYAKLRNVSVVVIQDEIANDNEQTMNQLFLMACAFGATT